MQTRTQPEGREPLEGREPPKILGGFFHEIAKNRLIYAMALPGLAFFFLFNYLPMAGIVVAFKNYKFSDGLFGSAWRNPWYQNFEFFFKSGAYVQLTRNTLLLNTAFIVFGTIFSVVLAIMINELIFRRAKKALQAGILMPYFISWVVVGVFSYALFNFDYGTINVLLKSLGFQPVNWYNDASLWPPILTVVHIWKNTGYTSIIYIAALAGIDPSYYEAARIDGASKFQQIRYINLPQLWPTVTTMTLLSVGRIMNADFGMFYSIVGQNPMLYPTADVIDTYVYRTLRTLGDVGMSSAVGFYQSCVAFVLVLGSNWLARRYQPDGSLF
ncbi:MAG: ABC transporter permease subunit [Clostridiales bacterium]|nr:ABC transporter permease subunit [Clostridiales bacterium]